MAFDPQVPVTETSLGVYFRERLTHYAQQLRPPPLEDTCWYLGNVLERFCRPEHLFVWQEGQYSLRPLALLYGDALQTSNARQRCAVLQQLGDMALFLGALFPQRYARFGLHQDYFIGMGGGAYDYLAENARHNRHIFAELARTFARMVGLVANACSRDNPVRHEDILAIYQRWLQNRDPLAEQQLRAIGIDLGGSEHRQ
ncbi:MAG: hypothetical protein ACO1PZ_12185 [Gammaproteobacteria bacterium]